uniref:Prefoldin subunit 2 n=1 Tax=Arcella intermedia TaxID=1963864 RepID=A0A6B2LPG8_9EUKA
MQQNPAGAGNITAKDVQALQRMQADYKAISRKIGELEMQKDEHNLVLKALSKLEPSRRCYRLVGGVLVERTVGEVSPAVNSNKENIEKSIDTLMGELKERNNQMNEFAREHGLLKSISKDEATQPQTNDQQKKPTTGVLV